MPTEGPQPVSRIEQLVAELEGELSNWKREGLDPGSVNANTLDTHIRTIMLVRWLVEKGLATAEELDELFVEIKTSELKELRELLAPQVRKARITSPGGIVLPDNLKGNDHK